MGLITLLVAFLLLPLSTAEQVTFLVAGVGGIILYVLVDSVDLLFETEGAGATAKRAGLAGFLYLEVLDASFSFDGVIGAFAITQDVVIIMLGLGIGALLEQQAGQVRNPRGQFAALGLGELGRGVGGHQLVEQHHQSAPGASQLCLHRRHLLGQTLVVAQPKVLPLGQQQALLLDLRNQALEGALRLALRRGRRRYGQQR